MKSILFTFLFSVFFINASAQRNWFNINENPNVPYKNPGSTAVMSFLLPGSGYFANDMIKEGFVTLGFELGLAGLGMYFYTKPVPTTTTFTIVGGFPILFEGPDPVIEKRNKNIAFSLLGLAGAIHLFQFTHSTLLTNKSNKINGFAKNNKPYELFLSTRGNGLALSLSF